MIPVPLVVCSFGEKAWGTWGCGDCAAIAMAGKLVGRWLEFGRYDVTTLAPLMPTCGIS